MPQVNKTSLGRPRSTSLEEVGRAALRMFVERGFDETTLDDIAAELGVGRRTLFRYYGSKNDMVWGDFDAVLDRLRRELAACDPQLSMMAGLRMAVIASNLYPDEALRELRIRIRLITTVPALQAHSMLRYAAWRTVVAEFAALRLGGSEHDLLPRSLGYAALAASTSAFAYWVEHPGTDHVTLLDRCYRMLESGFAPAGGAGG